MQDLIKPHNIHKLLAKINESEAHNPQPVYRIRKIGPNFPEFTDSNRNSKVPQRRRPKVLLPDLCLTESSDSFLSVIRPFNVNSRSVINRLYFKDPSEPHPHQKSESSLQISHFTARKTPRTPKNFVETHRKGFQTEENSDFYRHFFRIFLLKKSFPTEEDFFHALRTAFLVKSHDPSEKIDQEVHIEKKQRQKERVKPLEMKPVVKNIDFPMVFKEFLLEKHRLDLRLFEKVLGIAEKSRPREVEPRAIELKPAIPIVLPKMFRQEVFLEHLFSQLRNKEDIDETVISQLKGLILAQENAISALEIQINSLEGSSVPRTTDASSFELKKKGFLLEIERSKRQESGSVLEPDGLSLETEIGRKGQVLKSSLNSLNPRKAPSELEDKPGLLASRARFFWRMPIEESRVFEALINEKLRANRRILRSLRKAQKREVQTKGREGEKEGNKYEDSGLSEDIEEEEEDYGVFDEEIEKSLGEGKNPMNKSLDFHEIIEKAFRAKEMAKKRRAERKILREKEEPPSERSQKSESLDKFEELPTNMQKDSVVYQKRTEKFAVKSEKISRVSPFQEGEAIHLRNTFRPVKAKLEPFKTSHQETDPTEDLFPSTQSFGFNPSFVSVNESVKLSEIAADKVEATGDRHIRSSAYRIVENMVVSHRKKPNEDPDRPEIKPSNFEKMNKERPSRMVDYSGVSEVQEEKDSREFPGEHPGSSNPNNDSFSRNDGLLDSYRDSQGGKLTLGLGEPPRVRKTMIDQRANPGIFPPKSGDGNDIINGIVQEKTTSILIKKTQFRHSQQPAIAHIQEQIPSGALKQTLKSPPKLENLVPGKNTEESNFLNPNLKLQIPKKQLQADPFSDSNVKKSIFLHNLEDSPSQVPVSQTLKPDLQKPSGKKSTLMLKSSIKKSAVPRKKLSKVQNHHDPSTHFDLNKESYDSLPPAGSEENLPESQKSFPEFEKEKDLELERATVPVQASKPSRFKVKGPSAHLSEEDTQRGGNEGENSEKISSSRPNSQRQISPERGAAGSVINPSGYREMQVQKEVGKSTRPLKNQKTVDPNDDINEDAKYDNMVFEDDPDLMVDLGSPGGFTLAKLTPGSPEDGKALMTQMIRKRLESLDNINSKAGPGQSPLLKSPMVMRPSIEPVSPGKNRVSEKRLIVNTSKDMVSGEQNEGSSRLSVRGKEDEGKSAVPRRKSELGSESAAIRNKISVIGGLGLEEPFTPEEELNLRGLKERIEGSLIDLKDGLDSDTKYTLFIYKQRQEQMNRLLAQIESNIEENIQTENDCQDQLRNFLEMRRKFIKENDKPYNSLKFSNQIIAGSEEGNHHQSLETETQEIDKIAGFLSLDQDLLTERQRRRLFELQGKVLRLLRGYLNKSRSRVKQKAQGSRVILSEETEVSGTRCEIVFREEDKSRIERRNETVKKAKSGSFEKNYRRYYESLKRLKNRNLGSFNATIGKLKNVRPKNWLLPHLKDL